ISASTPLEEFGPLAVARIFELDITVESARSAELVDHDAVIDDEMDRHERVDLLSIAAEAFHWVAHGRQIDHCRDTGEILHQHSRGSVLDFAGDRPLLLPVDHAL